MGYAKFPELGFFVIDLVAKWGQEIFRLGVLISLGDSAVVQLIFSEIQFLLTNPSLYVGKPMGVIRKAEH